MRRRKSCVIDICETKTFLCTRQIDTRYLFGHACRRFERSYHVAATIGEIFERNILVEV